MMRMFRLSLLLPFALAQGCAPGHSVAVTKDAAEASPVIIIAHRGASGERPEHTLLSYELAIAQGADFIEPDLVPTKDGVLVARHENNITDTTDVADHPEFAARKTTKTIDGERQTGWFTEDFTLAELKTLRARERLPMLRPGNKAFDGQAQIPTLDEIIALARRASAETGRTIGIYPETKHPSYFASIGLPLEARLVAALDAAGWRTAAAPVFIQSFEVANLKRLRTMTGVRLIQLMSAAGGPADGAAPSYAAMATPDGLRAIAAYAWGIGPEKAMILAPGAAAPSALVADAHAAGLKVHPWTFRAENFFLLPQYRTGTNPAAHGDLAGEITQFIGIGVDGLFTDYPYIAVQARGAEGRPTR
ncbi:glycerophosphodiester phosphodiesterase [Sphingomonas canadensis]|uniref:glycerophosphodiester phosphodiesterase n=1 Tax=Sphingomonas canadensis TaxID=1219257 RepID=A0ABW3H374_9SPHN|nr:glycerophosphodiester phosphodiesterase [Sphingomonas canadensis]MCW3835297.1 glycerophosphodiester phosphodiesterase [Sphingomonas canadensis]